MGPQPMGFAYDFIDRVGSECGQPLANVRAHRPEIGLDHLWLSGKASPQFLVLGRNSYRTSVEMTLSRHYASQREQSSRTKPKFFRAQECTDDHVARELESAIHPQTHPAAQPRLHQGTMSVAQAHFPREAGIFDGRDRRCTCTTVMAADANNVGASLRHAGGDDSPPGAGH